MRAVAAILLAALFWACPAWAENRDRCIACHLAGDPRLKEVFFWRAPLAQEQLSLCPVLGKAKTELLSLQSALDNLAGELARKKKERLWTEPLLLRLVELRESFRIFRAKPMASLSELKDEAAGIKDKLLRQVAKPLAGQQETAERRLMLGWALLCLLGAALLLLLNKQRALARAGRERRK